MVGTGDQKPNTGDLALEQRINLIARHAWRLIVAIVGGTVLLFGLIMIFTPGPAMVVIPFGLAILAAEFVWARRLLRRIKVTAKWKLRKQRKT